MVYFKVFILIFLIGHTAEASDFKLKCEGKYNSEKILNTEVNLKLRERNKKIGGAPPFEFILSSNGENVIELQGYNNWEPSRSYATAKLTGPGTFVELSVWKREYLMEARCTLLSH